MSNNRITEQTRKEAHEFIKDSKARRQAVVLYAFANGDELCVDEAIGKLYAEKLIPSRERNNVAPRITELLKKGLLRTTGKKKSVITGRTVATFKAVETE